MSVNTLSVRSPARLVRFISEVVRQDRQVDVVVASGDCYIGLLGYWISRRIKAPFAFDVYDKYDEFGGYRRWLGFDSFQFLLSKAEMRLFASRKLLGDLSPSPETDLVVLNGVDTERFFPRPMRESREQLELPQHTCFVGYFGGMEPDRGVSDLIDAVTALRRQGMPIELLLGGKLVSGVNTDQPGVRYLGNVPFNLMPIALASCDVLAIPYRRSAFMDSGSSNKIAESIACGKPLVVTRTPNFTANFPEQAKCLGSLLAEPGDVQDLARAVREQIESRVLVTMPDGMSWSDIAIAAAHKLSAL